MAIRKEIKRETTVNETTIETFTENDSLNNSQDDIKSLLNVSHYKQGDCDVFAKDPRCRDLYPKWGGLIMAAERHYQK